VPLAAGREPTPVAQVDALGSMPAQG